MAEPRDHILVLGVQLRSDMTTLGNVTCKVRVNGGSATTYTNVSSPAITQSGDITYGYQVVIPANTYADGDYVEVTWLYSATPYAYADYTIGPAAVDGAHYTNARGDNLANLDAAVSGVDEAVWAVGTRSLTTFGTLAADTATAVWAAGTRSLTTFGTLAADTATAVWNSLTSALTTVGSVGKLLVTNIDAAISTRLADADYTAPDNAGIAAIQAKTDLLGSAAVTVVAPVLASGNISLVQGDDYKAADNRALLFNSTAWPTLTGAGIALKIRKTSGGVSTTSFSGTALSASSVQVELSGSQTAAISAGEHNYDLVATLATSANIVTLGSGVCFVQSLP